VKGLVALLLVFALAQPAYAHGVGLPISPHEVWHHWSFDPLIVSSLLVGHWIYGRGVFRAWRQAGAGRVIPRWRVASFVTGELVLVIALVSPLDPLGETLLAAHMAQHVLLTAIAPPLLLLGAPALAWTWALPRAWRRAGTNVFVRAIAAGLDALSRPMVAAVIAIGVMWVWHAPALFEAALDDELIHTVEHLTFFAGVLIGWHAALSARVSAIMAASVTLLVFMGSGVLGGVLTLAPAPLYDWYGNSALLWGISPLEDQQIAGLLMWVVAGGVYLAAFAALAVRVASPGGVGRSRPSHGVMRASTSSRSMK
jgi:putative membrane protein